MWADTISNCNLKIKKILFNNICYSYLFLFPRPTHKIKFEYKNNALLFSFQHRLLFQSDVKYTIIQSTKICVLSPNCKQNVVIKLLLFLILDKNILLFSIVSCKVIALNLLCFIFWYQFFAYILGCFFKLIALSIIMIEAIAKVSRYFLLLPLKEWKSDDYIHRV